jgi:polysaccharide biosynthesis/export protein ExoF
MMTKNTLRKIAIVLSTALVVSVQSALAEEYVLGVGDRLKVKVQEWPDLGGEYSVTADGFVSLPLLGNINVAGRRLDDLGREISDLLQRRGSGAERPFAALEIVRYRPFSILGDVQRPGEYPYRPGLTVLEAVGMAGGYYRPEIGLLRLDRDMALAKGDIRALSAKQNRLLARETRLAAALAERDQMPVPVELQGNQDTPEISAILESERAALALDRDDARSDDEALEKVRSLYLNEIDSLRGQVNALTQERDGIQEQLKQLRALSAKGLALSPTLFSLERSFAQVVNQAESIGTSIVRAQQNITLAEQQTQERSFKRRRDNGRELQQTRDELTEIRARLRTAGDLLVEAQISAPAEARKLLAERSDESRFTLIRKDGETMQVIAADETTRVLPDDIIKVPMIHAKPYASNGPINLSKADDSDKAQR